MTDLAEITGGDESALQLTNNTKSAVQYTHTYKQKPPTFVSPGSGSFKK